jgi:hypothetical protein
MNKTILLLIILFLITLLVFSNTAVSKPPQFLSITLYNIPITFGNMDPNMTKEAEVNPLIINVDTNVASFNIEVEAGAVDFKSGRNSFPVSNLQWNTTNNFPGTNYTGVSAIAYSNLTTTGNYSLYHQLTIPPSQQAGTYDVSIKITASEIK